MDDKTKKQNNNWMSSGGTPESGPSFSSPESAPAPEYGNEIIKQIESKGETALELAERKEFNRPDDPRQKQIIPPQVQMQKPTPMADPPKYFGYNIPTSLISNPKAVSASRGKGDANASKTWLVMLVDRMLKIRASK